MATVILRFFLLFARSESKEREELILPATQVAVHGNWPINLLGTQRFRDASFCRVVTKCFFVSTSRKKSTGYLL